MTITQLRYRPTGDWWIRIWQMLQTVIVNLKIRRAERGGRELELPPELWRF